MKRISGIISILFVSSLCSVYSVYAQCLTPADADCSGDVSLTEVIDYIGLWYSCSSCYPQLFEVIEAYYGIHAPPEPGFPADYVSWWKFDGDALDVMGVNNGTFFGNSTTAYDQERKYGTDTNGHVLVLDGSGDYVEVDDDSSLRFGTGDFSISAWIKTDAIVTTATSGILTKGGVGKTPGIRFSLQDDNFYVLINNGSTYTMNTPHHQFKDGLWHHAVAVMDRGSNLSFYYDGSLSKVVPSTMDGSTDTSLGLFIGSSRYGDFNGSIDDVMVFSRALSAEDIFELYHSQKDVCTGVAKCSDIVDASECSGNPCGIGTGCEWDGTGCISSGETWFVRPLGGDYSREDGSSYYSAWDGLENVIWGKDGVNHGDTLYVCGLHLRNYTGGAWKTFRPGANGLDENRRITIRGDCPGSQGLDQGIVWGAGVMTHDQWIDEGNNVWSITSPGAHNSLWFFEDVSAESWNVLHRIMNQAALTGNWTFTNGDVVVRAASNGDVVNELEAGDFVRPTGGYWYEVASVIDENTFTITKAYQQATRSYDFGDTAMEDFSASIEDVSNIPGSYFSPDYALGSKFYVHTTDGGDPTGRIASNRLGYNIHVSDNHYLTWLNLKVYANYRWISYSYPGYESVTHMRWENVTLWYGEFIFFLFRNNNRDITFLNCDVGWGMNGIGFSEYPIGSGTTGDGSEPQDIHIKGCRIHHIGIPYGTSDSHSIAFNGASDIVIEENEMHDVGSGIAFYNFNRNQAIRNITIRYNWVHDTHDNWGANSRGYEFSTGPGQAPGTRAIVHNNLGGPNVSEVCFRYNWNELGEFYNNVAYDCGQSYRFTGYTYPVNVSMKNCISMNPRISHIEFRSNGTEGEYMFDSDNNIFWPISGDQFFFWEYHPDAVTPLKGFMNLSGWQSLSRNGSSFDPNSIVADPMFVSSDPKVPAGFKLLPGSPAIDNGTFVGLMRDYEGNAVPQDGDKNGTAEPDIGMFEHPG